MFRQSKTDQDRLRSWQNWADCHRNTLQAIGLPPGAYMFLDQWTQLVESGQIDAFRYPGNATDFSFMDLSREAMQQLYDFIISNPEFVPPCASLPGYLNVNLEGAT